MNFIKTLKNSLYRPAYIVDISKNRISKAIGYSVCLILLFSLVHGLYQGYLTGQLIAEANQTVQSRDFPDFTFEKGVFQLHSEESHIYTYGDHFRLILDPHNRYSINDLIRYPNWYYFTSDTLIFSIIGSSPTYVPLKRYAAIRFTRADLIQQLSLMQTIAPFVSTLLYLIFSLVSYLFRSGLLFSAALIAKMFLSNRKIKYHYIYSIVLYSMTIGLILFELFGLLLLFFPLPLNPYISSLPTLLLFYLPSASILFKSLQLAAKQWNNSTKL